MAWWVQVKELLNQQDSVDASERAGPLAEIQFWRERSVDLSGIRAQLDDEAVAAIVAVLEYAKARGVRGGGAQGAGAG